MEAAPAPTAALLCRLVRILASAAPAAAAVAPAAPAAATLAACTDVPAGRGGVDGVDVHPLGGRALRVPGAAVAAESVQAGIRGTSTACATGAVGGPFTRIGTRPAPAIPAQGAWEHDAPSTTAATGGAPARLPTAA